MRNRIGVCRCRPPRWIHKMERSTTKTLIENSTAIHYNGLVRQSIQIEPEWVDETAGDGQWIATVRYGIRPPDRAPACRYRR